MLLVPRTSIITNSIHDVQLFCCLALFALDMFAHGVCYEACRVVGKLENQKNTSFVLFSWHEAPTAFPCQWLGRNVAAMQLGNACSDGDEYLKRCIANKSTTSRRGHYGKHNIEIIFAVF